MMISVLFLVIGVVGVVQGEPMPPQNMGQTQGQGHSGVNVINEHEALPHVHDPWELKEGQGQEVKGDDVGSILINTVYSAVTPSGVVTPNPSSSSPAAIAAVPEIEMKKLKAASKGAGLSDAVSDRVVRAVKGLDLKYHEVVDLKKVMMNPATSADYADRVRRALEDALVDRHQNQNQQNGSSSSPSDLDSPFGRSTSLQDQGHPFLVTSLFPRPGLPGPLPSHLLTPIPSGVHVFYSTPLTDPALPEDLESLWTFLSHSSLSRKESFEIVQAAYLLGLTREQVFDIQHEFVTGAMSGRGAVQKLLEQLRQKVKLFQVKGQGSSSTPLDLSKPVDPATLQRFKTVSELSGLDKEASARLVRAVKNSGLMGEQVSQLGDVIQSTAASPEDLNTLLNHLEETDVSAYNRKLRDLSSISNAGEDQVQGQGQQPVENDVKNTNDFKFATPEQAKGADWIYTN